MRGGYVVHDIVPGVALVGEANARGVLSGVYMVDLETGERAVLRQHGG